GRRRQSASARRRYLRRWIADGAPPRPAAAPRQPPRPPPSRTGADCGRTSFRGRGGRRGPQRTEGSSEFGGKKRRLLPRGKMTALIEPVVVNELRIRLLRPAPRCLVELLRKSADGGRDSDALRSKKR